MPASAFTPSVLLLLATLTPHRAPSPVPRFAARIQQPPVCTRNHSSRSARPVTPASPLAPLRAFQSARNPAARRFRLAVAR